MNISIDKAREIMAAERKEHGAEWLFCFVIATGWCIIVGVAVFLVTL